MRATLIPRAAWMSILTFVAVWLAPWTARADGLGPGGFKLFMTLFVLVGLGGGMMAAGTVFLIIGWLIKRRKGK